jgi:hypothetical protein
VGAEPAPAAGDRRTECSVLCHYAQNGHIRSTNVERTATSPARPRADRNAPRAIGPTRRAAEFGFRMRSRRPVAHTHPATGRLRAITLPATLATPAIGDLAAPLWLPGPLPEKASIVSNLFSVAVVAFSEFWPYSRCRNPAPHDMRLSARPGFNRRNV